MAKKNDYVIVRTRDAGVHAGVLVSKKGDDVVLKDSRRMWRWFSGFTLSEAAEDGIDVAKSRIAKQLTRPHEIHGWCEILTCSKKAEESIRAGRDNG